MNNVFFFTDIHGHYPLYKAIINYCKNKDKDCLIVYGGDAADRRPYGYKIIKSLLQEPNVIYLYGNHEQLFVKAAKAILNNYKELNCDYSDVKIILEQMKKQDDVMYHLANEGYSTLYDWLLDGANIEVIEELQSLPRVFTYDKFDFCHAGGVYSIFQQGLKKPIQDYVETILIWDRNAISLGWEKDRIGVFGHTPTLYLPAIIYGRDKSFQNVHPCMWKELMGAKEKRGGYKIDMDTAVYATDKAFVLNCNNLTTTSFTYNVHTDLVKIEESIPIRSL